MTAEEIKAMVEETMQTLRDEGRRQGERQGERRFLLKQLRARFGDVPQEAAARIDAAEPEDLERWGERVLFAKNLHEVFGDS
jgi:hypothetical protein